MFEDATFDSTGGIHTHSRDWMIAAFLFYASILLAMILIPLVDPQALPRQAIAFLMEAPAPQPAQLPQRPAPTARSTTEPQYNPFVAPRTIPQIIVIPNKPEPPLVGTLFPDTGIPGGTGNPLPGQPAPHVIHPDVRTVRVPSSVEAGLLIEKITPRYPPIALASRIEGTVMLAATISKNGSIENLRVTSGPAMLRQAALDAVQHWRYRPYLLDGQPVEVETTVDVIFTLER